MAAVMTVVDPMDKCVDHAEDPFNPAKFSVSAQSRSVSFQSRSVSSAELSPTDTDWPVVVFSTAALSWCVEEA